MSNLDNITEKINADAKALIEEIENKKNSEIKELEEINDREIDKIQEDMMEKARKDAESQREKILSQAALRARDEELTAKNKVLDKVYDRSVKKLKEMPDEEYLKFVENSLKAMSLKGTEVLIAQKGKKSLLKDLGIKVSKDREVESGFAIEDGNVLMNYTFDALVDFYRQETEGEVVKILFDRGE